MSYELGEDAKKAIREYLEDARLSFSVPVAAEIAIETEIAAERLVPADKLTQAAERYEPRDEAVESLGASLGVLMPEERPDVQAALRQALRTEMRLLCEYPAYILEDTDG